MTVHLVIQMLSYLSDKISLLFLKNANGAGPRKKKIKKADVLASLFF